MTFDGSRWTKPKVIDSGVQLMSVSCPTRRFCAVTTVDGFAVTFNGAQWLAPVSIDASTNEVQSVSCPTASFCVAVDWASQVIMYDGSSWAAPVLLAGQQYLTSVSCRRSRSAWR